MENIKKHLNYIGLGLIFVALFALRIWPHRKTIPYILAVLGVAAIGVYIYLNISQLKQKVRRKSFLYSSNLLLMIVFVLGIVVIANYFLSRHHKRFDFTEAKLHSLSDQSVTVLKALKNDVNIKCFFREDNFNKGKMENLLQIYAYHSNKVKYEFIDPDKNPGLVKRYEVTTDGTSILETGDKDNRITEATEEDLTNAIIKVTRGKEKTIYFLEGHGEKNIEDAEERGFSLAKGELEKMGYAVKALPLALADNFPKNIALLIVAGPEKDLLPNELETIRNYIYGGGRVMFMIDPETAPAMKEFLREFGVALEDDLVIDTVSRLLGGDYFMPVVNEYETHAITDKFRYATFFPYARSVEILEEKPEGITLDVIAKSSSNSWSERQLDEQEVKYGQDKDKAGPISLVAVGTVKYKDIGTAEDTGEKPEGPEAASKTEAEVLENPVAESAEEKTISDGRIAVFGDSDYISNSYYNLSGNGNFFLNTANWLTEEEDLISIQPKTQNPRTIQLSPTQGRLIFFVSVLILPLLVLITGIAIWVRRKSL